MYQLQKGRLSLHILLIYKIFFIFTIISFFSITIYNENILGQMLNDTEFDKQLKMQERELDQELNETAESFNETEQLEEQASIINIEIEVSKLLANYQINLT